MEPNIIDPINAILAAISAGSLAALKDTSSQMVKDAYNNLKSLLERRFADKPLAITTLAEYEKDQNTWKMPLQKILLDTEIDQDEIVVQNAHLLLELIPSQQATSTVKYSIQNNNSQGTVIGDHSHVEQHFG